MEPGVAKTPCELCQRFVIKLDDRGIVTGVLDRDRLGEPLERAAGARLPCKKCPKKSPADEHMFQLSPAHQRTLELFRLHRATGSAVTPEQMRDPILRQNFLILEEFAQKAESRQLAEALGVELAPLMLVHRPKG